MRNTYNFAGGPSLLPTPVLEKIKQQLMEYENSGQSILEISHRSEAFEHILQTCEQKLRELLHIKETHEILFLHGGASLQFSMIPMNLLQKHKKAAVLHTGIWTQKAIEELRKFGDCEIIQTSDFSIPKHYDIPEDVDYVYLCENDTVYGTKFHELPQKENMVLVADVSSCILSEPMDIDRYGLLFAGAQKNMGIAGLCIVIIRKDLLAHIPSGLPSMLDYRVHAKHNSMYNTPPIFSIYVCSLMLTWLQETYGTLQKVKEENEKKAALLYAYLDQSTIFHSKVLVEDRSIINVVFHCESETMEEQVILAAKEQGYLNIKGHPLTKGIRVSMYNSLSYEAIEHLVAFFRKFEQQVLQQS